MYFWIHTEIFMLRGVNNFILFFVQMWDNVIYVNPCFLTLVGSKPIYLMIIPKNDQWLLLLQIELEIKYLL